MGDVLVFNKTEGGPHEATAPRSKYAGSILDRVRAKAEAKATAILLDMIPRNWHGEHYGQSSWSGMGHFLWAAKVQTVKV